MRSLLATDSILDFDAFRLQNSIGNRHRYRHLQRPGLFAKLGLLGTARTRAGRFGSHHY